MLWISFQEDLILRKNSFQWALGVSAASLKIPKCAEKVYPKVAMRLLI